jgi:hypothetical protein
VSGGDSRIDNRFAEIREPPDFCDGTSCKEVRPSLSAQRRCRAFRQIILPVLHELSDSFIEPICVRIWHA